MKPPKCILKQEAISKNNGEKSSISSVASFTCNSKFSNSKTGYKKPKKGKKCPLSVAATRRTLVSPIPTNACSTPDAFETGVAMEPQCCFKRCLQIVGENLQHDLKSRFEHCYFKSVDPDLPHPSLEWSLWNIYKGIRKELDVVLSNSSPEIDTSKSRSLLSNSEVVSLRRSLTPELKTSWSPWAWSCNSVSSSDLETLSVTDSENDFIGFDQAECRLDYTKTRFSPKANTIESLFECGYQSQNVSTLKTLKSQIYPVVLVKRLVMKTPPRHVKLPLKSSPPHVQLHLSSPVPRVQLPLSSPAPHVQLPLSSPALHVQIPLSLPKLRSSTKIHRRIMN